MNLGWTEILLIGGIALLLFGPSKLPNLGRSLGESIRGFKKGLNEDPAADEKEAKQQITQNPQRPVNEQQPQTEEKKETHNS
ncbi:twin-arginine translocase TatA/TatE family subunit [Bdellovibrio bacteriovorus]|uniref:Sec-independent protein translocase protein TatA n=1 Tax=Bdellovibrio bacteriovorus (strain ATCC 15356 / DSM 50701 / NCIMB 9529 / HD100) TaxID=264462 RepID=Q6MK41_BDEBA|nr:twin-arginine translocase TatA/TatE family subunit [Bdellovibrio bacteriovorus]AHZ85072.1 preprotein translocase subunit TatA [Bdellovibrio bacteriovorus]BEV68960.1 Sec-independent protein translocase protein TatA [Bdellovibrio bacteriovorus]CAE80368.1 twin-arginine-dependent translocase protein [Bdellovibrio bacteriovorus HD100]